MLKSEEMLTKAVQCEDMADRAADRLTAQTLRGLAIQWRDMADQLDMLEHNPVYRIIRNRKE